MTLKDWYDQLTEQPDNWELRLVFSDWLEDQGLVEESRYQKWAVREKVHPHQSNQVTSAVSQCVGWPVGQQQSWDWICQNPRCRPDFLPQDLQSHILDLYDMDRSSETEIYSDLKEFPNIQVAEQVCLKGLTSWSKTTGVDWANWRFIDNEWSYE